MDQRSNTGVAEEATVDISQYLGFILRRWWLIVLGTLVAGMVAWVYSERQTPVYEAVTTVRVQETRGAASASSDALQTNMTLAVTYRELITTKPVMEGVIQEMGLSIAPRALARRVSVDIVRGTELLRIKVQDNDPRQAALIADTVAEVFKRQTEENKLSEIARLQSIAIVRGVSNFQDFVTAQLNALGALSVVETAEAPPSPVRPNKSLNILLAVTLGFIFSAAGAFAIEYLLDTVQTGEQVERRFRVTGLGGVAFWRRRDVGPYEVVMVKHPKAQFSEAHRNIRANIQFVSAARPVQAFVVGSSGASEGKSTVLSNLAVAFGQSGRSVIVVDSDLRRPSLHRFFGLRNGFGLSNYLASPEVDFEGVIQETGVERVRVITSGPIPPNPSELLESRRMGPLIDRLRKEADVILFDSPPLLGVVDGLLLASWLDGILLVGAASTRMDSVGAALEAVRKTNANLIGFVANKVHVGRFGYGYYRYPYYRQYYAYSGDGVEPAADGAGVKARGRGPLGLAKGAWRGPLGLTKGAWRGLRGRK